MKAFIGFSSGQDGVLTLYKTLTETDYDVYAINIQHKKIYAKNDVKYHEHYRKNIINWLRKNCRDFVCDSVVGQVAKWSPRWEGEKDYSEISEEKYKELLKQFHHRNVYHITVGEQWHAYSKAAQELGCDVIIGGNDKIQNIQSEAFRVEIVNLTSGPPVLFPLGKMGRMEIYHELPEELKERIAPCDDFKSMRTSGSCGKCRKCITKEVYEKLYLTKKYTIQELDRVYFDAYIKTKFKNGATEYGMAGLERLLNT